MLRIQKTFAFLLLSVFAFAACSGSSENSDRQNPRALSPQDSLIDLNIYNTSFKDIDGNEVSIADFKGKVVLVDFWETWCGPCLQVFPAMDSLRKEYANDFVMLSVNLHDADTEEDVKNFANRNGYDFVYGLDVNDVGPKVISVGIPFKVYFDPDGYLIKAELGSAGTEGDYQKAKAIIEEFKNS